MLDRNPPEDRPTSKRSTFYDYRLISMILPIVENRLERSPAKKE